MSIQSFRHKGLKRLFEADKARGLPANQVDKIKDVLAALDTAETIEDMEVMPGWRLHGLKGNLDGFWWPAPHRDTSF